MDEERAEAQFYHGTRAGFHGRGGLLLPRVSTGRPANHEGPSRLEDSAEFVYVTTDWDLAVAFARAAKGRGRPKVLTVSPHTPLRVDNSTVNGEDEPTYRCPGALVLGVEMVGEDD